MRDVLELEALALGGQELLDDIHDEAGAHVDEYYLWDGTSDERPERVSAYLGVRWQRVQVARRRQLARRCLPGQRDWVDRRRLGRT